MNDHAKTCNIGVDSSANSIKNNSCNSLDNMWCWGKNSLTNLKWTKSLHSLQSIKVYNSSFNDWFWHFSDLSLKFRQRRWNRAKQHMQSKPISSSEMKDNPFEFSEHGACLCAPPFWTVFERSNVVLAISVQPQEVNCFFKGASQKN